MTLIGLVDRIQVQTEGKQQPGLSGKFEILTEKAQITLHDSV